MITIPIERESTDTKLGAIYNEISKLEYASQTSRSEELETIKQRLFFLKWKRETLTIAYGFKKAEL